MDGKYRQAFAQLNPEQRQAVDTIDGPLLVLAGPGTGKTQLLSARVANILEKTDVSPHNILCLTFTDNAARNMRERLADLIGQPAYHVAIHTFHSFGVEIINQYPDYFDRQMLQQVDELGRYELLRQLFQELPHSNPLSARVGDDFVFLKDALASISQLKQNAVSPAELHQILDTNQKFFTQIEKEIADTFASSPLAKNLPAYEKLAESLRRAATGKTIFGFTDYASLAADELEQAIAKVGAGRFAPSITAWRNRWCIKNAANQHVMRDGGQNYRKLHALANIYQSLLDSMATQGLYDFDDMVIEAVHTIETSDELRFNLQERYQYVLVDEFQDTNKAQLRMLMSLGDNPVHEGKPNIMAVGDDDQAIYAFQGAEASNMSAFAKLYSVEPIILRDNYRSSAEILGAAEAVAAQITDRLAAPGDKRLNPIRDPDQRRLEHVSFVSELTQYDWVASQIAELVESGTAPEQIAVLAPRHRYLERLMPYLGQKRLPIAYERRENILEAPVIIQLLTMAKLVVAIAENHHDEIDALLAQVLAYEFWQIPSDTLIDLSLNCYKKNQHWLPALAKSKDKQLAAIASWLVVIAKKSHLEPLEYILDELTGNLPDGIDSGNDDPQKPSGKSKFHSPLKSYYFNTNNYETSTDDYLVLLGQLSTLRHRLRLWKPNKTLFAKDLSEFAQLHQSAGIKIIDENPHTQTTRAVQVMTAYKAKGLEFEHVFVINAQDEVWGPTARSQSSRISLPLNMPIEPAGESDNDKLRLLFVAMTRAKNSLVVSSYTNNLDSKPSPSLSFINDLASLRPTSIDKPATIKSIEILATDWSYRFRQVIADKPTLLEPLLSDYKLSVTHLNNYIDVVNGGPRYFLMHNLLRFPEAQSPSAAYGAAVHETIKWLQTSRNEAGGFPSTSQISDYFADMLGRKHLRSSDQKRLDKRGREALAKFFANPNAKLKSGDLVERGFHNEGVMIGEARLSGNIDLLRLNDGSAEVSDFKTGKPARSWQGRDEMEKIKLYKYRQQLMFYKILVEGSASFGKRTKVNTGRLEFVEPDEQGELLPALEVEFQVEEQSKFTELIYAVWQRIMSLDFPDVSKYPQTLRGIQAFEQDLVDGK